MTDLRKNPTDGGTGKKDEIFGGPSKGGERNEKKKDTKSGQKKTRTKRRGIFTGKKKKESWKKGRND